MPTLKIKTSFFLFAGILLIWSGLISALPSEPSKESPEKIYHARKQELKEFEPDKTKGIDLARHQALAVWCYNNGLRKEAVQEFMEIIKHVPEDKTAPSYLRLMDYDYYDGQWRPAKEIAQLEEKRTTQLLTHLKSKNEEKQAEAKTGLAKIKPIFKINPLVKALKDPEENLRTYAIDSLIEINRKELVPFLVESSIMDKSEAVREQALNAVQKIAVKESIPWYGYFAENGNGLARLRSVNALGALKQPAAVPYLVQTMYRVTILLRGEKVSQKDLRNFRIDTGDRYGDGSPIPDNALSLQLPWIERVSINTIATVPAGGEISLVNQLEATAQALEGITGEKLGTDYEKWVAWYEENSQ
ncbi:MAG: HEAT repeat domain-containing protein [Planctomycetota bacterium]